MGRQTDTPENSEVARHTRLERRGSVYYLRAKVPADLQKVKGLDGKKELKWSLKTSDPKKAAEMIDAESQKANAIFEAERQRLKPPIAGLEPTQAWAATPGRRFLILDAA